MPPELTPPSPSSTRRYLPWLLGVVTVLILIILVAWWLAPAKRQPGPAGPISLPSAGPATGTSVGQGSGTLMIPVSSDTSIQTINFLNDPATVADPANPGYYYLGYHTSMGPTDTSAVAAPPYEIEYIAATHYFNIALLKEPIGQARTGAEQYLLAHLGITPQQACELKYMVSVPESVNAQYAGENLGFSFCPQAVTLPQ